MSARSCASRAHRRTACPARAHWIARAVPQEPAPSTAIREGSSAFTSILRGAGGSRIVGGKQRLEIHRRQEQLRKAAVSDQARDDRARIRKQHARADHAGGTAEFLVREILHQESAGLLHLDQEGSLLTVLGRRSEEHTSELQS